VGGIRRSADACHRTIASPSRREFIGVTNIVSGRHGFPGRKSGPAKLDDCAIHGSDSGAELLVVEGDSAAAAVARVRNPQFQAVLPMQGKPLNAARAPRRKVLEHPFFGPLAEAVGAGVEAACEPQRSRYERVLVLTDPDADGIHCGFLVLLFFHHWLRPLLDAGRIQIVRPPWGEVVLAGELILAFSERELAGYAARARSEGGTVQRYRGLAAIDPDTIRETCLDPATRRTESVSSADVAAMIDMIAAVQPE
jgi:DNA gyrase subunit B